MAKENSGEQTSQGQRKNGGAFSPGDWVDVVAPAASFKREELEAGIHYLESELGLRARVPADILDNDLFFANSDENRYQQLEAALMNRESKLIWCVRGGYGTLRLMPQIRKLKPKQNKVIVGFSDVTSLAWVATEVWGWKFIHGPHLDRMGQRGLLPIESADFKAILFAKKAKLVHQDLVPRNVHAKNAALIRGKFKGGNLVTLQSHLGSKWAPQKATGVLFLEESNERGYRIDRILTHMKQAGFFSGCKAIVLGDFIGGEEKDGRSLVQSVLDRFSNEISIPVFSGLASGHSVMNRPLAFGGNVEIRGGKSPQLQFSSLT